MPQRGSRAFGLLWPPRAALVRAVPPTTRAAALGLISTPSCASLSSEVMGLSPRSTESSMSGLGSFVRASQLSDVAPPRATALSWASHTVSSLAVTLYDLLMRLVMPSWYLLDLHLFPSAAEFLRARAERKTRRYVESATDKFVASLMRGEITLLHKPALEAQDFAFAHSIFCGKHGKPFLLYLAWRAFVTLLTAAPYQASFTTVVDCATGAVLALFVEFRQGCHVHHFITALVDHESSKKHGIYVAKYEQMISACTQDGVRMLRMGPTTDALKASLGGVRLPLFVVASPVWARWHGRCSIVAFGVFTTAGLFAFLWLTQWHMDASGMGRLSTVEFFQLYGCCIAFVKALPLVSIGWRRVLANPRKYLLQTSFYAQGVVFGGFVFVAIASHTRGVLKHLLTIVDVHGMLCLGVTRIVRFTCAWPQISPLRLLDAICLFALVGDCVGRLGCHWYGCCFGRPIAAPRLYVKAAGASGPVQDAQKADSPGASGGSSDAEPANGTLNSSQNVRAAAAEVAAEPGPVFHPLSVVYLDRDSSVSRLRPELRLRPLLPTQLLQAGFAAAAQVALLTWLLAYPKIKTGLVGCLVLGIYSVGRCIFFFLREDECFKSNRSYTTVNIAAGTLAACAALGVYTHAFSRDVTVFDLRAPPEPRDAWSYTLVAGATALVNFLVQGLHHHEMVGRFPDLNALLAPITWHAPVPRLSRCSSASFGTSRVAPASRGLQIHSNWG